MVYNGIPSGKLWKDPPFLMGTSTISMAFFNSYVKLPEGIIGIHWDISTFMICDINVKL